MSAEAPPVPKSERLHWWTRFKNWLHRFFRRLAYLLGPIILTALVWLLVRWVTNPGFAQEVYIAGAASLFGLGTTVVFGKAVLHEAISLGPWQLALIVMWVNAASTYWYTYNLDLLERLPKIGPTLKQMRREAVATLKERPWIRRLSVVGVGAFVITPLPGSGALGGAIVGRLIGVSKFATFVSVSIAGVVVSAGYALLADKLAKSIEDTPEWLRIVGAVVVFGGIFFVMRWFTRRNAAKRAASDPEIAQDAPDATDGPAPEGPAAAPTAPMAVPE